MFKPFRKTSPNISKKIRSKKRVAVEWLCGALSFAYFLFYWENNVIDVTRYERFDRRIPQALDGTTVVQISDLHGKRFGRNDSKLMAKVRKENPDLIAVTGDLIDERDPKPERAKEVISRLAEIAPVFYVTGNHEGAFIDSFQAKVLDAIEKGGAYLLDNRQVEIIRGEDGKLNFEPFERGTEHTPTPNSILLAGICDPETTYSTMIPRIKQYRLNTEIMEDLLKEVPVDRNQFCALLTHRPEFLAKYARYGIDLALTGHAHGGQFRCPGLLPNGLYAPDQGFFPKYTCGRYDLDGTTEIVSRGLGSSVVPTRIFNRPNLVVYKLRTEP